MHCIAAIHAITSGDLEEIKNLHAAEGGHGSD
jgi:hypothetical protein